MKRLNKIIDNHGRWSELSTYTNRIETYLKSDFSQALENAKALLEAIAREICSSKGVEISESINFSSLIKKAFSAIGYSGDTLVTQISSALANIGQQMGNLRNDIGVTSHGKTLEELKERNNLVDELTKEFLIDTTVIVASFLIRTFENQNPLSGVRSVKPELHYEEEDAFNDYWDDSFGEFTMGDYSFPASEVMFYVDYNDYVKEHEIYTEDEG